MQFCGYRITRQYKVTQLLLDIVSAGFIIAMWAVIISKSDVLPDTIPLRVNKDGEGTAFGSKLLLLIWPCIAMLVMWASIHVSFYPKFLAWGKTLEEDIAQDYYNVIVSTLYMIRLIAILILFEFFFTGLETAVGIPSGFNIRIVCDLVIMLLLIRIRRRRLKRLEYYS